MESLNKWFCNILQYSHLWYLTTLYLKKKWEKLYTMTWNLKSFRLSLIYKNIHRRLYCDILLCWWLSVPSLPSWGKISLDLVPRGCLSSHAVKFLDGNSLSFVSKEVIFLFISHFLSRGRKLFEIYILYMLSVQFIKPTCASSCIIVQRVRFCSFFELAALDRYT